MSRVPRKQCLDCRYPMLELRDFDGVSSRDAPGFEQRDAHEYRWLGLWGYAFDALGDIWRWLGKAGRMRKVQRLKEEMLTNFPNTVICPRCFSAIERE